MSQFNRVDIYFL